MDPVAPNGAGVAQLMHTVVLDVWKGLVNVEAF